MDTKDKELGRKSNPAFVEVSLYLLKMVMSQSPSTLLRVKSTSGAPVHLSFTRLYMQLTNELGQPGDAGGPPSDIPV
ncbi:MAG: hypothetical protein Q8O43_03635 [Dehalococcoidia bacterium]|nr:hypothetical protein [Dehalococcoidia bacterium]